MEDRNLAGRIHALQDVLVRIVAGDLECRAELSPAEDELDAVAAGINMLVEELAYELRQQRRLREEQDQVFQTLTDALAVLDVDGRIRQANRAMGQLLDTPVSGLRGRSIADLCQDQGEARRQLVELQARGRLVQIELDMLDRRGQRIPVVVDAARLPDTATGEPAGFVWIARDLRELRELLAEAARAEAERERAEELARAHVSLESTIAELRATQTQLLHAQKMEAVGRLAGGIAHDFNNMLVVILSSATFLEEALGPEHNGTEDVRLIQETSRRARALTRQLLTFARDQPGELRSISVNSMIRDNDDMMRRLVGEQVEWTHALQDGIWHTSADETQMQQVLMNLVLNARDAMPEGGRLSVETRNLVVEGRHEGVPDLTPGEYVVMSIRDTGSGIPESIRDRLFEPFFTTKPAGRGTGLGLSTCYGIVRRLGGAIGVRSEPGLGSEFAVYLPRTAEAAAERIRPVERTDDGQDHGTVLVGEDEAQVRRVLVRALERRGYEVLQADDGTRALDRLDPEGKPPDLVVTDVAMPGLDGISLAETLRYRYPDLPILFITGYSELDPAEQISGPLDVLRKPFVPNDLVARVRRLLENKD